MSQGTIKIYRGVQPATADAEVPKEQLVGTVYPDPESALAALAAGRTFSRVTVTEAGMDEPAEHIMQFFAYGHLREDLQEVSTQFAALAEWLVAELPRNPERTVALRKLLEAKDAAVRAKVAMT
jgi:hypothetical protein